VKWRVVKTLDIAIAHRLSGGEELVGKCGRLHGHNLKVQVEVESDRLVEPGFVVNFNTLKNVITTFDHSLLNDQLDKPTMEYFAALLWERLESKIKEVNSSAKLVKVSVKEAEGSECVLEKGR